MEIIKITLERMSQVLPQTVKDSDLSINAKKVLATIINYYLVRDKVRTTGFLAISNEDLRKSVGIGKEYLESAVQELKECRLVERKAGKKWKAGEKSMASEYRLVKENLTKPIHKPTSDDLLELLFSTPSKPLCTGDSPTNTITNTETNSETNTNSETETNTNSETGTYSGTYSDVIEVKLDEVYQNRLENASTLAEVNIATHDFVEACKINGYQVSEERLDELKVLRDKVKIHLYYSMNTSR